MFSLTQNFRAKLAGFGFSQKRRLHGYVGTAAYMAPELLKEEPRTEACDVYAMVRSEVLLPQSDTNVKELDGSSGLNEICKL